MKLKEAISPETIDSRLERYRKPIENKLKGDVGKYILSLEMIVDMLAKSSSKSDPEFTSFMQDVDRNVSRMGTSGARRSDQKRAPKSAGAPEKGADDKPGSLPSLSSLVASEPSTPPPVPSGIKDPGSRLRQPAEKKPRQFDEPKGGEEWQDWMKKQKEKDVDWNPQKLSTAGLPKLKTPKAVKDYQLDLKRAREKRK